MMTSPPLLHTSCKNPRLLDLSRVIRGDSFPRSFLFWFRPYLIWDTVVSQEDFFMNLSVFLIRERGKGIYGRSFNLDLRIQSHNALLQAFALLTEQYEVMLAERKMVMGVTEIDFLGMQLSQGQYKAQPHISRELLRFPDRNLTKPQSNSFLVLLIT